MNILTNHYFKPVMFNKFVIIYLITAIFIKPAKANLQHKIPVESFKVVTSQFFATFTTGAQVKSAASRAYYANVEGQVDYILPRTGGVIKAGAVILTIDQALAVALKGRRELAFRAAKLAHARNEQLFAKRFISLAKFQSSKVEVKAAQAELVKAQIAYNNMVIIAPFTGEIGVIKVRVGDFVKKGDYLFSLINNQEMMMFLEVPETLYSAISKDTEVILSDISGHVADGKITAITPYLSDRGTISLEVVTSKASNFIHNSYLNCQLIINKHQALAIPEQAVLNNDMGNFVYQITRDNTIKQQYVKLGMRTNNMIEILANDTIFEGDLIVLEGLTKVQEGTKVEVIN